MGHLFLSYSRRDTEFVRRLNDALKARGRETWVDWEGIRPSAEWVKEIQAAIDAADAFVFVISPDSAASRECQRELDHALARHKRLIPLLYRETPPEQLDDAISSHNWVFARDADDFEEALDRLTDAADTDLAWLRAHTRLLARALEWDGHGRDASYGLAGSDLRASEKLLTEAGEKQPRLTGLHVEYVLASRRAATRRAMAQRGAAAVALCLMAVLGAVAWAVSRQARLSRAGDLRARGVAALADRDAMAAEVLLARSLTLHDRPETRERLLEARVSGARLGWAGPDAAEPAGAAAAVEVAAVSADGARVALADDAGGTLAVWDVGRRRAEAFRLPLRGGEGPPAACFGGPGGGALLAAADARAGGSGGARVRVWDARTGRPRASFRLPAGAGEVNGIALSPDGARAATAGSDRTVRLWHVPSGLPLRTLTGFPEQVTAVRFSPDGRRLACGGWAEDVTLWDVPAGRPLFALRGHEAPVTDVAFSPDGALLASASRDGRVWLWDAREGRRLRPLVGHRTGVLSVAFSPDGRLIASGSGGGAVRLWDAETAQNLTTLRGGNGSDVRAVAFARAGGGRSLVSGDRSGAVRVWDVGSVDREAEVRALRGHVGPATAVAFSPDGARLASGGQDRTVRLWDARTGAAGAVLNGGHAGGVFCLAYSPDGKRLASGGRGGAVRLWDAATGAPLRAALAQGGAVRQVAFRPGGGNLLASGGDDGSVRLWDADTGRALLRLPADDPVLACDFSADGRRLAAATHDGDLLLWEVSGGDGGGTPSARLLATVRRAHEGPARGVAFDPRRGGRWLATAGEDGVARLWDVAALAEGAAAAAAAAPVRAFRAHEGAAWDLTFHPDGRTLATVGSDGALRLWDVSKAGAGRRDAPLPRPVTLRTGRRGVLWWVRFSPDGKRVATAGQERAVRLWDLDRVRATLAADPDALLAEAERTTGLDADDADDGGDGGDGETLRAVRPASP